MMTETAVEKEVCHSCGVDVREGTQFCYACGKPVKIIADDEAIVAAVPIAKPDESIDLQEPAPTESKSERRASAALERKRSRAGQRKPTKLVWEQPNRSSNRIFVLVCLLIFVVAAAVVATTVFFN